MSCSVHLFVFLNLSIDLFILFSLSFFLLHFLFRSPVDATAPHSACLLTWKQRYNRRAAHCERPTSRLKGLFTSMRRMIQLTFYFDFNTFLLGFTNFFLFTIVLLATLSIVAAITSVGTNGFDRS